MSATTSSSTATTPRSSIELAKSVSKQPAISITSISSSASSHTTQPKARALWQSVKQHVREHHESVNAVYANYYGQGYERDVRQKSSGNSGNVWVYERGVYGRS